MPVYNGSKYLRKAIDSVLSQTFRDWELIIVDDGSKDATPEILHQYSDSRIIKMRQDNVGESGARNTAMMHANGDYISFLDSDDIYFPNALADLSGFLDRHSEHDVVLSDGYFCNENAKKLFKLSCHKPGVYVGNILEPLTLSPSVIPVPVCAMTRHAIIERHGIRFDETLRIGEDWDFWIQLARYAQFGYLDKPTCMYRVHQTNLTRTSGFRRRMGDLERARMKVLGSDWFGRLSAHTRRQFFYGLMIELLAGQIVKQKEILESEPLRNLSFHDQADLWRLVGMEYLVKNTELEFARYCLQKAMHQSPNERKNRYLNWTLKNLGWSVTVMSARLWRLVHKFISVLKATGQHRPRPAPSGLRPVGD